MEEELKKLEGNEIDDVAEKEADKAMDAGTSPDELAGISDNNSGNNVADNNATSLATTPVPTEEEIEDANFNSETEGTPETANVEEIKNDGERKFTQSEVNDLVGKTRIESRNKTFEYIYGRYGVNDEEGLDNLIGNAQRYDSLKEEYDGAKSNWDNERTARDSEFAELKEKVALMESGIDRERYDDAKFILKGKGLEVNAENIANELISHPEWKKNESVKKYEPKEPVSSISVLGNEKVAPEHTETEEDYAMDKLFKLK